MMKPHTKANFTCNQPGHKPPQQLPNYYTIRYEHRSLPTYVLVSDQPYQRNVDPKHVDEIIDNFNALYLDEVIVSYRDGKYFVVDGQNRIAAFKKMSGGGHCMVNCKVFFGLTEKDEASMFYHLDSIKKKLRFNEKINAAKNAKDNPDIQAVEEILSSYGVTWSLTGSRSGKSKVISASRALLDSYATYGHCIFSQAINLLLMTWGGNGKTLTSPYIKGACLFVQKYAQSASEEVFVRKLKNVTPGEMAALAKQETGVREQALKYARVFLTKYNHHTQTGRLPDVLHDDE